MANRSLRPRKPRPVETSRRSAGIEISLNVGHALSDVLDFIVHAHDEGPRRDSRGRLVFGPPRLKVADAFRLQAKLRGLLDTRAPRRRPQ
jgi:hypothetical protein